MGQKLSSEQLDLYKFIYKLLYQEWNPIGVEDLPEDEYQGYLPQIFRLAIKGSSSEKIAEYLLSIEKERMGLEGNKKLCHKIADKIINKKKEFGL